MVEKLEWDPKMGILVYRCPSHGDTDEAMIIYFFDGQKVTEESHYCLRCYRDFLDMNVGRMEKIDG